VKKKTITIIESPFAAPSLSGLTRNRLYLLDAMRDSIRRGEQPFASHAIYPQVLDDNDMFERSLGMELGFNMLFVADKVAVYNDLGISDGMNVGVQRAEMANRTFRKDNPLEIIYRSIPYGQWKKHDG